MDNDQLLNQIQVLLEGMERRVDQKIADLETRITARFDRLNERLEMLAGIVAVLAPVVIRLDSRVQKLEDAK
jgi:hypothetical protein